MDMQVHKAGAGHQVLTNLSQRSCGPLLALSIIGAPIRSAVRLIPSSPGPILQPATSCKIGL
jgi:hypothetical protein